MKYSFVRPRFLALVLLMSGVLVGGLFSPQVGALPSTYHDVSTRISGTTDTLQANLQSPHSVSADGRYVVFTTDASNMVTGDTNGKKDIFVRDTKNNTTTMASVSTAGVEGDSHSEFAAISNSGRYVVFESSSDNLVSGVTGTTYSHIYLRDTVANTTTLVDTSATGTIGNGYASNPQVSVDGRFVVFRATGTNLVSGISSAVKYQIYVKDTHTGAIKALSITSGGAQGNDDSVNPDISCDGGVVTFGTEATNLGVPTGQPSRYDAVVVGLGWGGNELSNITSATQYGVDGNVQVSCDGNVVLFNSGSTDVVSPATPSGYENVYEYNRSTGVTIQVSLGDSNAQSNASSTSRGIASAMSGDGRYVAFSSAATNMDTSVSHGTYTGPNGDVFIRDVKAGTTDTADILAMGGGRSGYVNAGAAVSMSADGSVVAFPYITPSTSTPERSLISGLTSGLTTGFSDVYSAEMSY